MSPWFGPWFYCRGDFWCLDGSDTGLQDLLYFIAFEVRALLVGAIGLDLGVDRRGSRAIGRACGDLG